MGVRAKRILSVFRSESLPSGVSADEVSEIIRMEFCLRSREALDPAR
jgi:hypothetical protein